MFQVLFSTAVTIKTPHFNSTTLTLTEVLQITSINTQATIKNLFKHILANQFLCIQFLQFVVDPLRFGTAAL